MKQYVISTLAIAGFVWVSPALAADNYQPQIQCHFWASNPSATVGTPYKPSPYYSHDLGHFHAIEVTRTGTGSYSVQCNGVGPDAIRGGTILVSKYASAGYCIVGGWSGSDLSAIVYCYDAAGALADSYFDFLYVK